MRKRPNWLAAQVSPPHGDTWRDKEIPVGEIRRILGELSAESSPRISMLGRLAIYA